MEKGYEAWLKFNLSQRVHLNFMENISQILCLLITCGLYYPVTTAVIGGIYFIGRLIYTFGYLAGAKTRMLGVPFVMLIQFLLPFFTIASLAMLATKG